jgi:phage protein D
MAQLYHLWPDLEIDGTPLSAEGESQLEQVIVDHHQHLPSMFAISFRDPDRDMISQLNVNIGSTITVKVTPPGGSPETLIKGEVTGLEAEYDATSLRTILRGYDLSHRLHRGRNTQTYKNVTDSDIVQKVAGNANLPIGQIDSTSVTYEHVSQANQSDWDFLKSRAREIGYEMGMDDGKFYFRQPVQSSNAPANGDYDSHTDSLQLVFGDDLIEFHPRVTSAEQVSTVNVRGWDPDQKQAVVGSASAATVAATLQDDPSTLAGTFGGPTFTLVDRPLPQQAMADGAASSAAEIIAGAFAEADGIALGNPKLKAGSTVSVGVVGDHFEGQYTLSGARHVFGDNGYRTHFVISGRQDRSLLGLASLGASNGHASAGGAPINGVVIAQVTDNNDPNDQARVKLKFPWLDDNYESDWARITQLGAGAKQSGAVWIPEKDDEVLVAFEFGDIRRPYVVGSLYNGQDTPNLGDGLFDNGTVKRRGFISRVGHKFIFFDDEDGDKKGIAIISSDGKFKISINESNSEIKITSGGKVTVKSDQDMSFESGANLKLKAGQALSLEASTNLDMKASSGATLDGGPQLEVKSSAQLKVSSAMVDVNNGALQVM